MNRCRDIVKNMKITPDENGWSGTYHFYYAEGGTAREVMDNLLNIIGAEKRHRKRRNKKFTFPYEINLN
jgi:hypothetical protein